MVCNFITGLFSKYHLVVSVVLFVSSVNKKQQPPSQTTPSRTLILRLFLCLARYFLKSSLKRTSQDLLRNGFESSPPTLRIF